MSAVAGMGKNLMSKQGSSQMEKGRMLQPEAGNNKAEKDNHPSSNTCAEQGSTFSYGPASNALKWTRNSCSLWTKFVRKKVMKEFFFLRKSSLDRSGGGEGRAVCLQGAGPQKHLCCVWKKKDSNQEGKCLEMASLCVIMEELEGSESCLSVHQDDLELKSTCGQFNVLPELVTGSPC